MLTANCKSANSWALSAIANPQILSVPVLQILKFLLIILKSQIYKFLQNTAQLCLKTVLKVVFSLNFYYVQLLIRALYAIFVSRKICICSRAEVFIPQITNPQSVTFAEGPQI
jgi:hypothetical protein